MVALLHGGSPFRVWQPDSFIIRLSRRSSFNDGWDTLAVMDYLYSTSCEFSEIRKPFTKTTLWLIKSWLVLFLSMKERIE